MVMLKIYMIIDIAVLFSVNLAIFQLETDVQFPFTNILDIKGYRNISPYIKIRPRRRGGYYWYSITTLISL